MAIRHSVTAAGLGRKLGASDWDNNHTFTGTPGKLLGADGAEIDPASIAGTNGGVGSSAGYSALFSAAPGMVVGTGITRIRTSGYSADGIGGADYIHSASVTSGTVAANPRTQFLAADGRGFKLDVTQLLTAEMFGAKVNDSSAQAANLAAIKAALEFFPTANSQYSPTIHLGPGIYYISDTLEPQAVWHLKGQGSGIYTGGTQGVNTTRLIAPAGKTVVRFSAATFGTNGYVGGIGGVSSGGSIIEGISIEQSGSPSDLTAHGIHARATPIIIDCVGVNLGGDFIHIRGSTIPENTGNFGSPNQWRVINCTAHSCGGNGLYVEGADANAGYSIGFDTRPEVLGCGILDRSQLSNAHYGVHLAGYGNKGVHHNGFIWQLVTFSNTGTTPGTDSLVWSKLIATTPSANFPAWNVATTYLPRLPFLILNGSPVYGYTEFGATTGHSNGLVQGTMNGTTETNVFGTENTLGFINRRGFARYRTDAGNGPLWPTYPSVGSHEEVSIGAVDQSSGEDGRAVILRYATGSGDDFHFSWNGNRNVEWRHGGRIMAWLTGKDTLDTFARSTAQPGILTLGPYAIGGSGDGTNDGYFGDYARIHMGVFNGIPTAGNHAQGEFAWNNLNPGNGTLGWSCTTAGTPGTWTAIPAVQFASALPGWVPASGGGTANFLRADGTWAAPPAGGGATTLTGDVTGSGTGSFATTLATVNSNTGTFGGAATVPQFSVNGKGLVTGVTAVSIAIAQGAVANLTTDLAAKAPSTRSISTTAPLTGGGDLSADRTLSIAAATTSLPGSMSAQDKARLDANFTFYRSLLDCSGSHIAARVAGTYGMGQGQPIAISGTGTLYPLNTIYIAAADYPSVGTLAAKLRIRAALYVNDVAPTGNFTFALYPVTRPATSGGAGLVIFTLGSAVTGSAATIITAPAADSSNVVVGSDFALPADGHYVIGVLTTATVAASSHLHMSALLQMRYA